MDLKVYQQMIALEERHWWFVARRLILEQFIKKINLPKDARIFEAGCGTGGNLAMLSRHGRVYGMELNETARRFANDRGLGEIQPGRLPDEIPFPGQVFDLVVLLDVLEHLEEDTASLKALCMRLKPNGWLIITVPAFPWLWTKQDEILHHYRRYTRRNLDDVVRGAGYDPRFVGYFNSVLFPLISGARLLHRLLDWKGNELAMPPKLINQALTSLFAIERHLIGRISLPFGVSLLLSAQRSSVVQAGETLRKREG